MTALIIGLGAIGQRHARNLRTLLGSDASILAYRVRGLRHLITPQLQLVEGDVEGEYGIQVFRDLGAALAHNPSIALVCNPSSIHVPTALACVRAGCDVFVEKPLASDVAGLPELKREAERLRRIIMVGFQLRFHPCVIALQELVRRRTLGRLLAVRATVGEYLPGWHPYEDYRRAYAAKAALGGGVILTQIHEFDYLYSLFGLPRRVWTVGGHLSDLQVEVEDVASTLMEFEYDTRVLPVHLHQDYVQRPPGRSCEVIGTDGKALMDLAALSLTVHQSPPDVPAVQRWDGWDRNEAFLGELRHFLECVDSRRTPVVDLEDGIASLRMALAAKESMTTGRVIEFAHATPNS